MPENRERLLRVKEILQTTDEDHPITCAKILTQLDSMGIDCNRKSVLRDIDFLKEYGMDLIYLFWPRTRLEISARQSKM